MPLILVLISFSLNALKQRKRKVHIKKTKFRSDFRDAETSSA